MCEHKWRSFKKQHSRKPYNFSQIEISAFSMSPNAQLHQHTNHTPHSPIHKIVLTKCILSNCITVSTEFLARIIQFQ